MTFNKKVIGATALVLCMMVVAVVPLMDSDSAANPDIDFVEAVNNYSADIGINEIVLAETTGNAVNITVNTDATEIDKIDLNLDGAYAKFKNAFDGFTVGIYDNYGEGGTQRSTIQVITAGELTNASDFLIRLAQTVKDAVKDNQDVSDYSGTIIINGESYDLNIQVDICDPFKTLANRLFVSGPFEFQANYVNGKFSSMGVTVNMDQNIYDVLGYSQSALKNAKVSDVIAKFAADGVLGTLVEDTDEANYIDLICGKINAANGLATMFANNVKFTCNGSDVAFTAPTVSAKAGFQGLMETLSSAMATNFTMTVGSYADSTSGGAITFKQMGLKFLSGGDVFATLNVAPVVTYGQYVSVTAPAVEGGTVTITPAANILPGDEITITIAPANPSYTISSVKYMVGNVEKKDLEAVASQSVAVLFEEGAHTIAVTFNQEFYTVTWVNYDDTVLETDSDVAYGTTPTYDGATPVKAATDKYTYEFAGWEPAVGPITGNVTYKAVFTEIVKPVSKDTTVDFISDTTDATVVTAKVDDIKDSGKETVVVGKDVDSSDDAADWTVEIPAGYFSNVAAGQNVSVDLANVTQDIPSDIPASQAEKLKSMTIVSVVMKVGGQQVSNLGEKVTVKVAYTLKDGQTADDVFVYYVDTASGKIVKYDSTYADGFITFTTDHFSYWAIGGEIDTSFERNPELLLAICLVSAIVIPIIMGLVIFRKD